MVLDVVIVARTVPAEIGELEYTLFKSWYPADEMVAHYGYDLQVLSALDSASACDITDDENFARRLFERVCDRAVRPMHLLDCLQNCLD